MEPGRPPPAKDRIQFVRPKIWFLRRALLCAKDSQDGRRRNDRVVCACAAGRLAVEFVALADRGLPGRHLDSRWSGSDSGRSARRSFDATGDARVNTCPGWRERDILPGGRRIGCTPFRLWHRPIWPQEIVLYYGRCLSHRHSAIGFLMEFLELRILSRGDRRRDWRRIRSDQFRDRRTNSRARARPC